MDYSCPHCGKSLRWKLLKSRRNSEGIEMLCPKCLSSIRPKEYERETVFGLISGGFAVGGNVSYTFLKDSDRSLGIVLLVAGLLAATCIATLMHKQLSSSKRYEAAPPYKSFDNDEQVRQSTQLGGRND